MSQQRREATVWPGLYSYSFEVATKFASRVTKRYSTYITAIKVTQANYAPGLEVGEWMLTSKYDPRIVAARKADAKQ